jgi:branched-chain amino acid aminotransferase
MPDEILKADELFLTGTAAEITPVGKIDKTEFAIGPVTKRLMDAYADLVRQKPKATAAA